MGKESTKDNIWYPEMVMKDLVSVGGLLKSDLGYDIVDIEGKRFFYKTKPFAIVAWKKEEYMILGFGKEFEDIEINEIAKAFVRVLGYCPFVKYVTHQNGEDFTVLEWATQDEDGKFIDIMALPMCKNVHRVKDDYRGIS